MTTLSIRRTIERIPIVGLIQAGPTSDNADSSNPPLTGIQDICPAARPGDFFLEVTGDSMINAGIRPGQLALMRPDIRPNQGDICAIWINGEGGTLKRLFFTDTEARLVPENPEYAERICPVGDVQVQGVLIATIDVQYFRDGLSGHDTRR